MNRSEMLELLEPSVAAMDYDLVDVECSSGGRRGGLVRLYIDKADGVTVDDCALVSGQVGAILDVAEAIQGHYVLEVSSPGVDRILRTRRHFQEHLDLEIRVQLGEALHGSRKLIGRLAAVTDKGIVMQVSGEDVALDYGMIHKARLVPKFD